MQTVSSCEMVPPLMRTLCWTSHTQLWHLSGCNISTKSWSFGVQISAFKRVWAVQCNAKLAMCKCLQWLSSCSVRRSAVTVARHNGSHITTEAQWNRTPWPPKGILILPTTFPAFISCKSVQNSFRYSHSAPLHIVLPGIHWLSVFPSSCIRLL